MDQANKLKEEGNKMLHGTSFIHIVHPNPHPPHANCSRTTYITPALPPDHKFEKACELYSEAIKLHPTAILYSNRAMAAIKMESYGVALADAEAALE